MSADDWRQRAACRDVDPELFFPIGVTDHARMQADDAIAVCRTCWVRDHCLQYALEHRISEGIWGGLTEAERRRMHRRKTAPVHHERTA